SPRPSPLSTVRLRSPQAGARGKWAALLLILTVFANAAAAQGTRPAAPAPAAAAAEELWAEGSPEQFWVARGVAGSAASGLKPPAEPQTDLYVRARGDPAWQRATPQAMALRITALSHRGPQ